MIPPEAWAKSLHMLFGLVAVRRGPHWKLTRIAAEQNPFGDGAIDEGLLIGEALAEVMKYVPLPTKELGVVGAIGQLGAVVYMTFEPRLAVDKAIASGQLMITPQGEIVQRVQAPPAPRTARPAPDRPFMPDPIAEQELVGSHTPASSTPAPLDGREQRVDPGANGDTAASMLEGMGDAPLAAVTHQTGDTRTDGVQLTGVAPTSLLRNDEDPEPALLQAFRPGAQPVPIDVLAASNGSDVPLLDRLAPAPTVEGHPASRELG